MPTRSAVAAPGGRRGRPSRGRRRPVSDQADGRRGRSSSSADVFADGHDVLAAALLYRRARRADVAARCRWRRSATTAGRRRSVVDDARPLRVHGRRLGRSVRAPGGTSCRRSSAPGRTSASELLEGPRSSARRSARVRGAADADERCGRRRRRSATRASAQPRARRRRRSPWSWQTAMAAHADRSRATRYDRVARGHGRARARAVRRVVRDVPALGGHRSDAQRARSTKPRRGCPTSRRWASTCSTCRRSIRSAAASARDRTTRSTPGPDDPGSPWAIGAEDGRPHGDRAGARHARRLRSLRRRRRARHGLEIALDLAFQARPIIPTSASIPSGSGTGPTARSSTPRTRRRSTRTSTRSTSSRSDWQALWHELKRVIEFWIGHGVTIFRVDNPHTKPFRFWEWALAEIKRAASRRRSSCPRRSPGRR